MNSMTNSEEALLIFENSALTQRHAEKSVVANKAYSEIIKCIEYLKSTNKIHLLKPFLSHTSPGVRLWAARYLLNKYTDDSIVVIQEIIENCSKDIISFNAEMLLMEWRKGNLSF